jgi:hypothetical protein
MKELNAEDRYQVRKLQMDVDKRSLEVQKAQQDLDRFLLEMEHKYGLLDQESSIDPKTGTIKAAASSRNGKARTEALLVPELGEAAA